jgi:hypothetical protein
MAGIVYLGQIYSAAPSGATPPRSGSYGLVISPVSVYEYVSGAWSVTPVETGSNPFTFVEGWDGKATLNLTQLSATYTFNSLLAGNVNFKSVQGSYFVNQTYTSVITVTPTQKMLIMLANGHFALYDGAAWNDMSTGLLPATGSTVTSYGFNDAFNGQYAFLQLNTQQLQLVNVKYDSHNEFNMGISAPTVTTEGAYSMVGNPSTIYQYSAIFFSGTGNYQSLSIVGASANYAFQSYYSLYNGSLSSLQVPNVMMSGTPHNLVSNVGNIIARFYNVDLSQPGAPTGQNNEIGYCSTGLYVFITSPSPAWYPLKIDTVTFDSDAQEFQAFNITDPATLVKYHGNTAPHSYTATAYDLCGVYLPSQSFFNIYSNPTLQAQYQGYTVLTSDLVPMYVSARGTSTIINTGNSFIFRDIRTGINYLIRNDQNMMQAFHPAQMLDKAVTKKYTYAGFSDADNGINLLESNIQVFKFNMNTLVSSIVLDGSAYPAPPANAQVLYLYPVVTSVNQDIVYNINTNLWNVTTSQIVTTGSISFAFEFWSGGAKNTWIYLIEYTPAAAASSFAAASNSGSLPESFNGVINAAAIGNAWTAGPTGGTDITFTDGTITLNTNGNYKISLDVTYTLNQAVANTNAIPQFSLVPSAGATAAGNLPEVSLNYNATTLTGPIQNGHVYIDTLLAVVGSETVTINYYAGTLPLNITITSINVNITEL